MAEDHGAELGDDFEGASVQVFRVRRERFVEFEFSMAPELAIELVMPVAEFERFCDEHHLRRLPGEPGVDAAVDHLIREHGLTPVPVTGGSTA